uniref:Leucine-rich repeat protein n=2 Tax=Culex tarsalis TaxID=7177 RepID=A0A1Q3F4G8_CULTA
MPTLLQLSAENNLIEQLIIDELHEEAATEYRLQYLNLANNRLRSIRELKDLQALKELRLDDNLLEYIEMDTFAGMSKLKKLSLSKNRINAIATTDPIELPSLEFFSLAHNNLTKLAVGNWKLLQLTDLKLNDNRLISLDVDNFDQFVSLEKLSIAGNSWYCFWLSKAIKNIGRYVALNGKDEECPATMPIDDICCSMTVVSEDQPAHADIAERIRLFEESQTRMKSELYQKLERAKAWWNEEFGKVEVKTKELKRDADELIRLSSDDNKVKPEDVEKLSAGLTKAEDDLNDVQSLVESNGKFEQEITNLLYMVIEQKNRLLQTVKNATNLQEEMRAYKTSFDNKVK